jgi:hypothetical protein
MMLCISKASHKAAIVAALTVAAAAPANAFWPVIDVTSIAQQVQQVQQEIAQVQQTLILVQTARQNLQALRGDIGMSNIVGRLSTVTVILQQARSSCQSALAGRLMPKVCRVEANTAQAQAQQLGSEMAQIQALQAAANGVPGGLAANQLQAKALAEVALQLEELRQAQNATQQQRTIDNQYIEHTLYGPSAFSASDI